MSDDYGSIPARCLPSHRPPLDEGLGCSLQNAHPFGFARCLHGSIRIDRRIKRNAVVRMGNEKVLTRRFKAKVAVGGVLIIPLQTSITAKPSCQHAFMEMP